MATAHKKPSSLEPLPRQEVSPAAKALLKPILPVYRFLSSLKLAVLSLSLLAACLAYATWFESRHGTPAAQEYVYQTRGFAILLGFLGANILCAALIRLPWKRRQLGFVVTHAGLLVILAGCWYAKVTGDEGQVAIPEGDVRDELVRNEQPMIRVRQMNPENPQEALHEWELPFRPGAFAWGPGQPRPYPLLNTFNPLQFLFPGDDMPEEVLTKPKDAFVLVVKSHIPTSAPAMEHRPDPSGTPMARIRPTFKAPGMPAMREMFQEDEERWFDCDRRFYKVIKSVFPAQLSFQYVDRPELVNDFLNPPADPGTLGVARFRYTDKSGSLRTHDLKLDGQENKPVTLPESDLSVTFTGRVALRPAEVGLSSTLGEEIAIAQFDVSKAGAAAVKHNAMAGMPMVPNIMQTEKEGQPAPKGLVSINYDPPPAMEAVGNGLSGLVEVLGTPEGTLYHRIWGRPEPGKTGAQLRSKGELPKDREIVAFGGGPGGGPVTIAFRVDQYLPRGVSREICEAIDLPRMQRGNGLAASLVALSVKGEDGRPVTREFFIRRSATSEPTWKTVEFPNNEVYQVAYDIDRLPLGFELKLVDFDRGFDPGTEQASRFQSEVRLTDKSLGVLDRGYTIKMNEPLTYKGYSFYQASYIREQDPRTGRETGRVQSVLQVGKNPGRLPIYLGCLFVVLGTLLQFVMRAGIFSDGHRRERSHVAAEPIAEATATGGTVAPEVLAAAAGKSRHDVEPL